MKKILVVALLLLFVLSTYSDLFPIKVEPTNFKIVYQTSSPVSLIGGELYQYDIDYSKYREDWDRQPIINYSTKEDLPLECSQSSCVSNAEGNAPYRELVINFSDKTRKSGIFLAYDSSLKENYDFIVFVKDSELVVEKETPGLFSPVFLGALAITIILELMVAAVFVLRTKISKNILIYVVIANLISLPIVWFAFPLLGSSILVVLVSEIFAVIFEACFIFFTNKKVISIRNAFLLSIVMNLVSFFVGGAVFSAITGR